jgi:membrane dipeptidase
MKKLFRRTLVFLALLLLGFFIIIPPLVESLLNHVVSHQAAPPSKEASNLHAQLRIVDLHADPLLWGRDLAKRSSRGAVDVPRMIEGNVALGIFTAVTKSPRGLNYERNDSDSDTIVWLALAQRWPPRTWGSLTERALYLAGRFRKTASESGGRLVPIRTARDLKNYLERRQQNANVTAGLLGIEGGHALDGKLENLDALFDVGYRYISLTHFFDNEFAGSSAGMVKEGLTPLGRQLVERMNEKHAIIDLAHASPSAIQDVLAFSKRPVFVSHGGLKGACYSNRNLSDEEARGVAHSGGVIGIGFWDTAVCDDDVQAIARSMRYAVNLVGSDHVALGSVFDGAVTVPFDSAHLVELTDALLSNGFTPEEIRAIMGENALRFLFQNLPE